MASGKNSRAGMPKRNGTGNKKAVKKRKPGLNADKKRTAPGKNGGRPPQQPPLNRQIKNKSIHGGGETAQRRKRPYTGDDIWRDRDYSYHQGGESSYSPPASYYAGRGQMSYEDFVRNRELFGGEEELYLRRNRRTGGTVKRTPEEQGRNKKDGYKRKRTEKPGQPGGFDRKKAGEEKGSAKKKRSKEKMNERARRKKIKRHADRASRTMTPRKRKIKRFMTGFSIFIVIAVISVMLSLTVFFKMEKIIVTGETRYSQEEIISLSGIETGENIFLCDKSAASKKIVDALPYVEEAKVGFVIPNTITIEIVEETPSYAMGYADGYYIVGENGRILEKTADNYYDLPIVQGAEISTDRVGDYANFSDSKVTSILAELVRVLDAYAFEDITVIDVSDTANIRFVYDDRIIVVLGIPEDIAYKVKTAQTIINDKLDPNGTGLIKGRLDVSMCNETKKSYFNENEIYDPSSGSLDTSVKQTENTQTATEAETENSGETEPQGETQEAVLEETEEVTEEAAQEAEEVSQETEPAGGAEGDPEEAIQENPPENQEETAAEAAG